MPFDGSGNFIRTFPAGGWQGDAAANIKIKADRHDQHDSDLASGLSNAICKDGQSSPTADIPMNGKKITNLGAPVAPTDAATRYYVDNSTGRARISDGPPSSPVAGDLWWDSDSGNLLVYYNDGDSLQWVQTNVSAPLTQAIGSMVDSVVGTYAANADLTAVIPFDDTIPQVGEGTQIISVSITPKSITNKLRCRFRGQGSASAANGMTVALFTGASVNALAATNQSVPVAANSYSVLLECEFVPGVTTAVTVSVRAGPATAGTIRLNGVHNARTYGGVNVSTLVVEEIMA